MRKVLYAAVLLTVAALFVQIVSAQNQQADRPLVVSVMHAAGTVDVTGVNYAKRTVLLRWPGGRVGTYTVGREVRNLNQISPGDKLDGLVLRRLAIHSETGGSKPGIYEFSTLETAPLGAKPGLIASDMVTAIGKVDKIDYGKREITVTGPYQTRTYQMAPDVPNLDQVKKGDNIVVQYDETVIMNVRMQ